MQQSLIRELAAEVHQGLLELSSIRHPAVQRVEQILAERKTGSKVSFPNQWCDFATCVLAGHMARMASSTEIDLVMGRAPPSQDSHWWLRVASLHVDITCDQFQGAPPCPFVAGESKWHARRYPEQLTCNAFTRGLEEEYFEQAVVSLAASLDSLGSVRQAASMRVIRQCALDGDQE